jgi:competence protein ComEC
MAVGHGAGVLVELPNRQTLLYDAGTMGAPDSAVQAISAVLWSRGITHLDAVVLSHADADHYNALPELLDRFTVGAVYVSPVMFQQMTGTAPDGPRTAAQRREQPRQAFEGPPPLDILRQAIERAGVPLRTVCFPQRFRLPPPATIHVLHPPAMGGAAGDNPNSVVLALDQAGRGLLLTGDLARPGLEEVTAEPWSCDVLMVPHHGSKSSDPERLAQWCTPQWVVISGALGDSSSAVEELYTAHGATVLHTARHGAVRFVVDERGTIHVETWRQPSQNP